MKALLVIDMPSSCIDCPFTLAHICDGAKQTISDIKGRHESCPLKPMLKKKDSAFKRTGYDYVVSVNDDVDEGYLLGWNACLEEIEK